MHRKVKVVLSGLVAAFALTACFAPGQSETLREKLRAKLLARMHPQTQTAVAGGKTVTITSGGIQRSFIVHVPPHPDSNPGVILVFHGGSLGSAAKLEGQIKLDAVADQQGFLTVYPETANKNWTDGRIATQGGPDDVGFIRDVVSYLERNYRVPSNKVFATGLSNGGIFTYYLACTAPNLVRAIAPVSANMAEAQQSVCAAPRPMPVMMFSGTDDPLMPYNGGQPKLAKLIERFKGPITDTMLSSKNTAAFWAKVDGCKGAATRNLPTVVNDGTSVTETDYSNCSSGKAVTLYSINGAGHGWPGTGGTGSRMTGKNSNNISADDQMTAFFTRYGL